MPVAKITKILSATDAGESKTHQSGILIPVVDGEQLFPESMRGRDGSMFQCLDHTGREWTFRFRHRAKEHESRITCVVGYIRRYLLRSGDRIILEAPKNADDPYKISFDPSEDCQMEGEELLEGFQEGFTRTILVNQYERDPRNRNAAIKYHGVRCFGCRLEMAEMYGEIAYGFIHIHHVKPLASIKNPEAPNIDDLIPLCPNCHAIVHLASPPLTVTNLKEIVRKNKEIPK